MYFDYYNLIDTLPVKDKAILLIAINDYMFKDIEPNLTGHNQAIFNTLKNQLNLSKCNSKRRTKKGTEREPKENQNETEEEPKENKTSILYFKFYISNFKFINNNNLLINKIEEWLKYKQENNFKYKETGLKSLLKQIDSNCEKYGTNCIIELIDECMANGYKGIIFDKLKGKQKETKPEWMDKEFKEEPASEEDIQQMEDLLKEFK